MTINLKSVVLLALGAAALGGRSLASPITDDLFLNEISRGVGDASIVLSDSDLLHVAFQVSKSGHTVTVQRAERPNVSANWNTSSVHLSASYQISSVSGRNAGETIYVAGVQSDGSDIIEKWVFDYRRGSIDILMLPGSGSGSGSGPPTLPPLGTPIQPPSWATGTRESDLFLNPWTVPYAPPAHGSDIPAPTRTVIFNPRNSVGHIRNIVVDPEGRFLLVQLHNTGKLYRWDLNALTFPVPVSLAFTDLVADLDPSTGVPFLSKHGLYMRYFDHPLEGRLLMLRTLSTGFGSSTLWASVLKDADNNGYWETKQDWTVKQWFAGTYPQSLVPTYPN